MRKAFLRLADGTLYEGYSFGAESNKIGEVVFNTAMNGYTESLSDPSYRGQIVVETYPMIGNYGIPSSELSPEGISFFWESEKLQVEGFIISDYSETYSHWNAKESLATALKDAGIPGICGIDTRALTKHLRECGAMKGEIIIEGVKEPAVDHRYEDENLVAMVSCKEVTRYGNGEKTVVLLDCGVKHNIIRELISPDFTLVRVPWDYDFNTLEWDGLFLSNGPGNPAMCKKAIEHIREAIKGDKPIYGICMGNQLLSLAAGAKTVKMKYGHRSHNQPVRMVGTNKCYITSQNHGFAVDAKTLPNDWEEYFVNLNDGTNEGIRHKTKPFFSAQFHPEACGGPKDTLFIFEDFKKAVLKK